MADTTVVPGAKIRTIGRSFSEDGTEWFPRVMPNVTMLRFQTAGGHTLDVNLADLPEHIIRQAAAFGLNTTIGNAAGGVEDEADIIDALEDRIASLTAGNWAAERQSGPRGSDIVDAVARVYKDAGKDYPEAARNDLMQKLYSKELKPQAVLNKDPRIAAAYAAIKAERQAARLAKLKDAAAKTAGELPTF